MSAGNLREGINALDKSVGHVASAMREGERFTQQLEPVVTHFGQSVESILTIVKGYQEGRLQFAESLKSLQAVVENAHKEASLTESQLKSMERASIILTESQLKVANYVAQVSNVLGETHKAFADQMRDTIGNVNSSFTQSLTSAVNKVSSTVNELSDILDKLDFSRLNK